MTVAISDKIKTIPAGLEKYLGKGEMVLPSVDTIRDELAKVPTGKVTTIPLMRESIAKKLGVTTACPKTTLKMLRSMVDDRSSGAYKVLNGKGELMAKDTQLQAALLNEDGLEIDYSKSKLKVVSFKENLFA